MLSCSQHPAAPAGIPFDKEGNTAMAGKLHVRARLIPLLLILLLAAQPFAAAFADDAELLRDLPGQWADEYDGAGAVLTFAEDGTVSLYCYGAGKDGGFARTFEGTWTYELVPDMMDRLTLLFTSSDDPQTAGGLPLECVFDVYAESWVEDDVLNTWLILEAVRYSGTSPFEAVYGDAGTALHREQGPNMRVVHCSDYVSLRAERSTSSDRLAKVPLGALVLAFPQAGQENGFTWCVYHDEYGYILSEYLEAVE